MLGEKVWDVDRVAVHSSRVEVSCNVATLPATPSVHTTFLMF